jgi:hypothetical protein
MIIKVGNCSINVEAVLKMGKEKFLKSHPHLDDAEEVWAAVEQYGLDEKPKPKSGKK